MSENSFNHLPLGTMLKGQYRIDGVLGRGGFGVTYAAHDLSLDREVAVKECFPRGLVYRVKDGVTVRLYDDMENKKDAFERSKRRTLEEAQTLVRAQALPHAVRVYDGFQENGTAYLVMEHVHGETLTRRVEREGRLSWAAASALLLPLAVDLHKLHEKNIMHRDISPDNIMIRRDTGEAVLLDFGASHKIVDETTKETNSLRMGYAPIEQYGGSLANQDGRTDEHAFCATLYYALTGGTPLDAMARYIGERLMPPSELGSDIPAACEAVLLRGLAVGRDERYSTMIRLRAAFEIAERNPAMHTVDVPDGEATEELERRLLASAQIGLNVGKKPEDLPAYLRGKKIMKCAPGSVYAAAHPRTEGVKTAPVHKEHKPEKKQPDTLAMPRTVEQPVAASKKRGGSKVVALLSAMIVLLAVVLIIMLMMLLGGDKKQEPAPTPVPVVTAVPTEAPTAEPTEEPTAEPTEAPTAETTEEPTAEPTEEPTAEPAEEPTAEPADEPTEEPTAEPTEELTAEPTEEPTAEPTVEPTAEPTEEPTAEPTEEPTAEPTATPTAEPTATPTAEPTATPTAEPTATPTAEPTATPTAEPTATPTAEPTATPEPAGRVVVMPAVESAPTAEPTAAPAATPGPDDRIVVMPAVESAADEVPTAEPTVMPTAEPVRRTSKDKQYELDDYGNGTCRIHKYNGKAVRLEIPAEIDGLRVIVVDGFDNHQKLQEVTIPEGVETIDADAFYSSLKLRKVKIPESVTSIGKYAFYDCPALEGITIPAGVWKIEENAFRDCTGLKNVTLVDGIRIIGDRAFYGCSSLLEITIPQSVVLMGDECFRDCVSLRDVVWHSTDCKIGDNVFIGCEALPKTQMTVSEP